MSAGSTSSVNKNCVIISNVLGYQVPGPSVPVNLGLRFESYLEIICSNQKQEIPNGWSLKVTSNNIR